MKESSSHRKLEKLLNVPIQDEQNRRQALLDFVDWALKNDAIDLLSTLLELPQGLQLSNEEDLLPCFEP